MQNREQNFKGFEPDTYRFLMELGFYNEKSFFDANRARCKRVVQEPMRALASDLIPAALEMDPNFNTRLTTVVSRRTGIPAFRGISAHTAITVGSDFAIRIRARAKAFACTLRSTRMAMGTAWECTMQTRRS